VAPILLVNILPVYSGMNIHERNGCHAPLFSNYSSASKCLLARECDVTRERYCTLEQSEQKFLAQGINDNTKAARLGITVFQLVG